MLRAADRVLVRWTGFSSDRPEVCANEESMRFCVGVEGPLTASLCQNEVVADLKHRRPSVDQIIRIGIDTSKHVFQLHGVNAAEKPVLRKKLRRQDMVAFFTKLPPTALLHG
jgi:hypothetical protein